MIKLQLDKSPPNFDIAEPIKGEVSWDELPASCTAIELRLIWYTRGKGDLDSEVVASIQLSTPGPTGRQRFQFDPPVAPYSFSGKLISLIWAVEALQLPRGESPMVELVIAPGGSEVRLRAVEEPAR